MNFELIALGVGVALIVIGLIWIAARRSSSERADDLSDEDS